MLGTDPLGSVPLGSVEGSGTPELRTTQAGVLAAVEGNDLRVTQAYVMTAINFPTEQLRVTQAGILAAVKSAMDIRVTQAKVLVAGRGRVTNSRVRAWTFTLDGHDFYVLRLGDDETLVYDVYSEQWSCFTSGDLSVWRAQYGINWPGSDNYANTYNSNVLVGDDTLGLVWFLDPNQGYDDHPTEGVVTEQLFNRKVMGQVPLTGRDRVPCYQVFLDCDVGAPTADGTTVTLYTSDDAGHNFDNQGALTIVLDDFSQELYWTSLGQIRAPGRLFRLEDDGAITTIYGLDMRTEN